MNKFLLVNLVFLSLFTALNAQDFSFGTVDQAELNMPRYKNDEAAHAVFLNEYGEASIFSGSLGRITLRYTYHARIKIFDNDGIKYGTVTIPIYNSDNRDEAYENVDEIKGITIYKDDNGQVKTQELDLKKVYTTRENKNYQTVKFALPALRDGCIIEYTYRFDTPWFDNFHEWRFQGDIPKVRSKYEPHIPAFWTYNAVLKGSQKLTKNTSEREVQCFVFGATKGDCLHSTYEMDNIPAFVTEDYMTAPKNFMSAIYFELSEYTHPYTGDHKKVTVQWKDVENQLKKEDYFGVQLRKKDLLKDKITPVIAHIPDPLAKAKAIYNYIKQNIKWTNAGGIYSPDIRAALDKHYGSVADINLSLVSALNAAGFTADAVLLSTRDNGMVNKLYPVIKEFNYVIARVTIADKTYLLDATDAMLSFGMLPMRCLNDKGRAISMDKPSEWVDLLANQNQNNTYLFNLTLQDNGKLKGSLINRSSGYAAYEKRKAIKKFNTVQEYVENLDEKLTRVKIIKSNITNIDSLDLPVVENYEVELEGYDNLNHSSLSFNPYLFNRVVTNPFKLSDRTYPVDWGMPSDTKFVLNMILPDGYTIENEPKPESISLPNDGGRFVVMYQPNGNSFSFSNIISFKKPVYSSDEYQSLKELYNKIILEEKSEMIFKKKI
ncbi:hypothetical protein ABIB50_000317 [Mucilaginibacter sp. UYCu711]